MIIHHSSARTVFLVLALATGLSWTPPAAAQPLLQRLQAEHGPYWNKAFESASWRDADFGFVVVKSTAILYVVRQDDRRDTVESFRVCLMDQEPGFKERQGDGRTPDGIYRIVLLNPNSSYHLSMKMNYPNAVDNKRHARHTRLAGRRWSQGGDIFIHGSCASIGCLAMTDPVIEKLYLLVASLPAARRKIPVLVLPFDTEQEYLEAVRLADASYRATGDAYSLLLRDHFENMRAVWNYYTTTGRIPDITATPEGRYSLPAGID